MEDCSGIDAFRNFWEQVWQSPQDYDAIDDLVVEDFIFISGGRKIRSSADGRHANRQKRELTREFGRAPPEARVTTEPVGCR
jgi:hypothetical protein